MHYLTHEKASKTMTGRVLRSLVLVGASAAILLSNSAAHAQAGARLDIDKILSAASSAASKERNANAARENRFKAERTKQQGRLNNMKSERTRQERISDELDRQFKANEVKIVELQDELAKELGDLKQLFGVIQLSASEAQESYKTSLILSLIHI